MTDSKTPSAPPHKRLGPFPAFRLTKGVMNASEEDLEVSADACENWGNWSAAVVFAGVVFEIGVALAELPFDSAWEVGGSVTANALIALGIAGEIQFGAMGRRRQKELTRRSTDKLADAEKLAYLASSDAAAARSDASDAQRKLAAAIDRATELEARLQPRQINQEQWDAIQALVGEYDSVNIICETDAETKFLAKSLVDAFFAARIGVDSYGLEPGIHGIGVLVYEPKGYDGARPRTVRPLIDILQMSAATLPVHIITELPGYAVLPIVHGIGETGRGKIDAPAIIIGGRFILPPAHWPPFKPHAEDG